MKIFESYKKIAKSMLLEYAWDRKFGEPLPTLDDVMAEASQDDEDYVHIGYGKYKDKDQVDDPSAPVYKKDDSGAFIPSKGGDKKQSKGDEEKPVDKSKGLEPDDFERSFGGDTGIDADFEGEAPESMREPDDDDDDEDEDDKKEESITINGKQYREVTEYAWDRKLGESLPTLADVMKVKEEKKVTKKHILREMYERIGGK